MFRLLPALLCGAILLAGCKKDSPPAESTPAPASEATPAKPPPESKRADQARDEDEGKIELTPAVLERFIAYWDRELMAIQRALEDFGKLSKELEGKEESVGSTMTAVKRSEEISTRVEAEKKKALEDSGFTEAQVDYLRDLVASVVTGRMIVSEAGAEADPKKMIEEMRKSIAQLPPEQRAEAEREMAEMAKNLEGLRDASEARQQYGDAAVDLVIRYESKIAPLYKRAMNSAFGQ